MAAIEVVLLARYDESRSEESDSASLRWARRNGCQMKQLTLPFLVASMLNRSGERKKGDKKGGEEKEKKEKRS